MCELVNEIEDVICKHPNQTYYSLDELELVIKRIKSNDRYDVFFNHCHQLGASSGICFNNESEFPNQLIRRAKVVGPHQTLKEVDEYIDSSTNKIECGLLLYSIHIDTEYTFSNGVRLIRTSSLADSNLVEFLVREKISTGGIDTALLVHEYTTPKEFYSSIGTDRDTKDWSKINIKSELINKLNDTRLMLSLGRGSSHGIPVVGSFEIIPDCLNFLSRGIGYGVHPDPRTAFGPSIIQFELQKTDQLLIKFNSMSDEDKEGIRIVSKRLNDTKIDSDWANKCINLRICLENLFCGQNEYGIARAISDRSPIYTSFSKTRARNVYRFLSNAVHTGLSPSHATITEKEVTNEVHKTIVKFIDEGRYPSWTNNNLSRIEKLFNCIKNIF